MKKHSQKPFPRSFYDNFKIRIAHIFVFDVLCRHLDAGEDGWIRTNSREIVRLVKTHNGLNVQVITALLSTLEEFGYIRIIKNEGFRSVPERIHSMTNYQVRVLDSAWDSKEAVRAPLNDPELRRARYYAKKTSANL